MARPPDNERGPGTDHPPDLDKSQLDAGTHKGNPLDGLNPMRCQCWLCRWHRACDKAIELNGAVRLEGSHSVMVVADTVVAEVAANGGDIPDTYRLVRDDGRVCYVFVDEEPAA